MLKSITLHRPAVDNANGFQDAGADLTVGDAAKAGVIDEVRAKELVGSHGASGHYETAKSSRAPKAETAKRKPAAKAATPPAIETPKVADAIETKADDVELGTSG